jgi:hypothetical protein
MRGLCKREESKIEFTVEENMWTCIIEASQPNTSFLSQATHSQQPKTVVEGKRWQRGASTL